MTNTIKAIRGMHDLLPAVAAQHMAILDQARDLLCRFGYQPIVLPIVEQTALFKRGVGEVTDIVEKEMYTFDDRNGDSLSLRPEGTAGCVRAMLEHGLLHNQTQRVWYHGPMFRHERPQKGRYRQFFQLGVEAYGFAGPDIDVEMIALQSALWKALGIADKVKLEINTLATVECRIAYREKLIAYFENVVDQLDEDSQRRLHSNPLRILDSKNPAMTELLTNAPALQNYLDDISKQHFEQCLHMLDNLGIQYDVNPRLVRGLDYYSQCVYEWITDELGAQGTICAGGRYDSLITTLGGKPAPACGFAMGMERIALLLDEATETPADVYIVVQDESVAPRAAMLAQEVRKLRPHWQVILHCGGGSFKSQFKKADKSGADYALIVAEAELQQDSVTLKYLREDKPQQTLSLAQLDKELP